MTISLLVLGALKELHAAVSTVHDNTRGIEDRDPMHQLLQAVSELVMEPSTLQEDKRTTLHIQTLYESIIQQGHLDPFKQPLSMTPQSFIGLILKHMAPLSKESWSGLTVVNKALLFEETQDIYMIDIKPLYNAHIYEHITAALIANKLSM